MAITASLVKELRERTGAGMMECKKALVESDGDIEAAIEQMRKSGQAKAAKKAGRTAAEGVIVLSFNDDNTQAAMVEVNCETDFVAKDDNFTSFASAVAERVLSAADIHHHLLLLLERRVLLPIGPELGFGLPNEVLPEARVAQHRPAIIVASQQPAKLDLVDRIRLAQPVIERIRIGPPLGGKEQSLRRRVGGFVSRSHRAPRFKHVGSNRPPAPMAKAASVPNPAGP